VKTDAEIYGIIRLAARDLDGSVLAVSIETEGGNTYLVDDNKKGSDLLGYVGAKACVRGSVRHEDLFHIIEVFDFSIGS
jgi:hypothetical protein